MLNRNIKIILIVIIVGFLNACKSDKPELPNIVIIFIDDLGYADVGCFGARDYETPNIDRLAKEGVRFTNFYASQAVCSASRASLLTGCYSERVGIQGALNSFSNIGINPDETLIPEMLKEEGYATGIFGKWHLGHHQQFLPLKHGFDEYLGLPYSNDMWPVGFDGVPFKETDGWKSNYPPLPLIEGMQIIDTIATLDDQAKLTTLYTEKAVQFIEKHKSSPFFLYLPHSMVHVPIAVSDKFKGKSGKGLFADVMMELDWSVGEILNTLEQNGLSDNTLVIFTSDNGPWLNFGNYAGLAYPLREGKGNMWEGGPRVSTAMRWPEKIPAGLVCDNIASSIDILPTLAEITDAPLPELKIDGVSILPLMTGEDDAVPRSQFYYYYGGDLIAVRKNNWKLVFPHKYRSYKNVEPGKDGFPGPYGKGIVSEMELYHLKNDIGETTNLASQYPKIVEGLSIIGDSARTDLGDRIKNIKGMGVRKPGRREYEKTRVKHLAINEAITIKNNYSFQYAGSGDVTLVNGILGSLDYKDEEWLGFEGTDFEAIIDLENETTIKMIKCSFLKNQNSWIFCPSKIDISISSDGKNYQLIKSFNEDAGMKDYAHEVVEYKTDIINSTARFVKIHAKNIGTCPEWHAGAGGKSWLFVDEIIVE